MTQLASERFGKDVQDPEDKVAAAIVAAQAPKGSMNIPTLLDERRLKYEIPQGAFRHQMAFDRVMLWQIPEHHNEGRTYAGTTIIKTDMRKSNDEREAPRGIVVSAGLSALDTLRSNGIDLGHIVGYVRLAPWRKTVDCYLGKEVQALIIRAGDIVSSEDLMTGILGGACSIEVREKDGFADHWFKGVDGQVYKPSQPFSGEDF